jgi:hypothetical protein
MKSSKRLQTLRRILFRVAAVVLVVALCSVGFIVRQIQQHHALTPQPLAVNGPAGPAIYKPGHIPTAGSLLTALKGSGNGRTRQFKVADNWVMYWNFTCENSLEQCNFSAAVYNSNGKLNVQNKAVVEHRDESGYGTAQYQAGGTFYITVKADPTCNWQLTVKTAI